MKEELEKVKTIMDEWAHIPIADQWVKNDEGCHECLLSLDNFDVELNNWWSRLDDAIADLFAEIELIGKQ